MEKRSSDAGEVIIDRKKLNRNVRDMTPAEFASVLGEIKRELIGVMNYVQLAINLAENNIGADIRSNEAERN